MNNNCIFCKIIKGDIPCYKVWEDKKHLAFLSIFPNTEGVTVVITKKHYSSYIFDLPNKKISDLLIASKKTANLIVKNMKDVGRCGVVFEGFGVDHIHAKLFPLHGTKDMKKWKPLESGSEMKIYFKKYPGFISSHDGEKMKNNKLLKTAKIISGVN